MMRLKTLFFWVCVATLLSGVAARAQNGGRRGPPAAPTVPPLKENVTLEIKGSAVPNVPVDLTWTGVGPDFSEDWMEVVDNKVMLAHLQGTITAVDNGYLVKCQVGVNIPIVTGNSTAGGVRYSYMDAGAETTVRLKPGESADLVSQGGQTLTLTLVKGTTDYAGQKTPEPLTQHLQLDDNVQLNFTGVDFEGNPLNLTMGGTGPYFMADLRHGGQVVNGVMEHPVMHCSGELYAAADGYYLEYTATGLEIVVASTTGGANGNVSTIAWQPVGGHSTVALKLGEPVTVTQLNGRPLTLKLSKAD